MDLSKAFDCLSHDLIVAKLKAYGLSTDACEFLNSYLSDTKQRVKIGQNYSNWLNIKVCPRAPYKAHFCLTFLYPATQKVAGYYVIPSKL